MEAMKAVRSCNGEIYIKQRPRMSMSVGKNDPVYQKYLEKGYVLFDVSNVKIKGGIPENVIPDGYELGIYVEFTYIFTKEDLSQPKLTPKSR